MNARLENGRTRIRLPVLVLWMPLTALSSFNDWFVDQNAADCATGTGGPLDPFCTIQRAIDAASDGDRVLVAPGHYFERLGFTKDLELIGTAGRELTTVDAGAGPGPVVRVHAATTGSISGMTLRNGRGDYVHSSYFRGGGMRFMDATADQPTSFLLARSTVTSNLTTHAAGIDVGAHCSLTVLECEISDNSAGDFFGARGGGVWNGGTLTIANSTISGNRVSSTYFAGGTAVFNAGTCSITNTLVIANEATGLLSFGASTLGGFSSSSMTVRNCTVAFNGTDEEQTALNANGNTLVENSIFRGNPGVEISGGATVNYTCIDGGWSGAGTGNISVSPMLSGGNFVLDPASPCIDAGDPSARRTGVDHDGNPRVLDGRFDRVQRIDMGYVEFANVHLRGEVLPTHELTLSTPRSTFGLTLFLIGGLGAGEANFAPWGPLFVAPGTLAFIEPIGTTPTRQTYAIPPSLFGTDAVLQLLALGAPLGSGRRPGNFSNAVALTLE